MTASEDRFLHAVIFDAEGVVIDTEPVWDDVQAEFLSRRGHVYVRAELKPLLTGRPIDQATEIIKAKFGLPGSVQELSSERIELMHARLREGVRFMPGFLDFHSRIAGRYDLAIATSLDPDLLATVDRTLHVYDLVDGMVVTPEDVQGRGKPAPDIFIHAARMLGHPCERCLALEDSPSGVRSAVDASMFTVAITSTHPAELLTHADLTVAEFGDLDLDELDRLARLKSRNRTDLGPGLD